MGWGVGPSVAHASGVAVEGRDWAMVQVPASALVESYSNSGYRVTMREGVAEVEVRLSPLLSLDPFELPTDVGRDPVGVLVKSLLIDASSRYEAVARVLSWVAREIRYDLDREASQSPLGVLERRSGYCTGIARLTATLLNRAGIPSREVAGLVAIDNEGQSSLVYHRWVEIQYRDKGWVFSDPSSFHNYVPALYVRLASETLLPRANTDPAVLLERRDDRQVVDLAPLSPSGISTRRNSERQLAGALAVQVEGNPGGTAVLEGTGQRRAHPLISGSSTFVGLEPGSYVLTVLVAGEEPIKRELIFDDYVRGTILVSRFQGPGALAETIHSNSQPTTH